MEKDRFYYNSKFLGGMSGRPIRILSEYLGPLSALQINKIKDTVVFFGSARIKEGSEFYEKTRKLAKMITEWNMKNFKEIR